LFLPPGHRRLRLVEQWAAGKEVVRFGSASFRLSERLLTLGSSLLTWAGARWGAAPPFESGELIACTFECGNDANSGYALFEASEVVNHG
jgi:hypothetical protein